MKKIFGKDIDKKYLLANVFSIKNIVSSILFFILLFFLKSFELDLNDSFGFPSLPTCLYTTLVICSFTALLTTILGGVSGFILAKTLLPYRKLFLILLLIGIMIPVHAHTSIWLLLLGRNGLLTGFITWIWKDFSIYSNMGVIFIGIICYLPLATLICFIGFWQIHPGLEQQTSLYLSPFSRIFFVIFPQAMGYLTICGAVIFILASGDMTISDILNIPTLARQIYLCLALYYRLDWAMIFAVPLLIFLLLIILLLGNFLTRSSVAILGRISWSKEYLPFSQYSCFMVMIGTMPYLITIPIIFYGIGSFHHFHQIVKTTWTEVCNSLQIAILAATLSVILGLIVSWYIWRKIKGWQGFLVLILILFITPSSLLAILILRILQAGFEIPGLTNILIWLRDTDIPMILGVSVRYLPYSVALLSTGFFQVPLQLCEQMSLLGYNYFWQFIYIISVMKWCLIFTGLLIFGFCLGELEISILLIPPGVTTLPIRIFTLMHYGIRNDVCGGIMVLLILMILGIILCLPMVSKLEKIRKVITNRNSEKNF